jgi:hypothetical protein
MDTREIITKNIMLNKYVGGFHYERKYYKVPVPGKPGEYVVEKDDELSYHKDYEALMSVVEQISDVKHWTLNATIEWLAEQYMDDGIADKGELYEAVVAHVESVYGNKKQDISLIQLMDCENEVVGLYHNTKHTANPQGIIEVIIQEGAELAEKDDDFELMSYVDEKLESIFGIKRVSVELVTTEAL